MKKLLVPIIALIILVAFSFTAFAEVSPTARIIYNVLIHVNNTEAGWVERIDNEDGTITLIAHTNDGFVFGKWVITGDYELEHGTLELPNITFLPNGDVNIDVQYKTDEDKPGKRDDDDDSPDTGNAPLAEAMVVFFTAAGAAFVASKKLGK